MTTAPHIDCPLTRCASAAMPHLLEARDRLHSLAAPKAGRIAERIDDLLEQIIHLAGDVEAYGNTWTGGDMERIATSCREATAEYNGIYA